jgi:hypothetical protein
MANKKQPKKSTPKPMTPPKGMKPVKGCKK